MLTDIISHTDLQRSLLEVPAFKTLEDYNQTLQNIASELQSWQKPLKQLQLNSATLDAINGFNTFVQANPNVTLPITTLGMSIVADHSQYDALQTALEKLVTNASQAGLSTLHFQGNPTSFPKNFAENIMRYARQNGISLEIILPEHLQDQQITLDTIISNNQWDTIKNQKPTPAASVAPTPVRKAIKTRPRSMQFNAHLQIDVELEEESSIEIVQEIELANATEQDNQWDNDENDWVVYRKLTDFYDACAQGKHQNHFSLSKLAILKEKLPTYWATWFGDIQGHNRREDNNYLAGFTQEAAEQLILHADTFAAGFDFNHLPPGFLLVTQFSKTDSDSPQYLLHYNERYAILNPQRDPLAIDLSPKNTTPKIPFPLLDYALEKFNNSDSPRDQCLVALWKICANSRDKKLQDLFRQHFLTLRQCSAQVLQQINNLLTQQDGIQAFKILLEHAEDICGLPPVPDQHYQIPQEQQEEHAFEQQLTNISQHLRSKYSTLAHAMSPTNWHNPIDDHLLLLYLQNNPLLKIIQTWCEKLSLNNRHLDALLCLYVQYGETGLIKLFEQWENTDLAFLQALHHHIYREHPNYEDFLAPEYQTTQERIANYPAEKKAWLYTLLKQHNKPNESTHINYLVNAFEIFAKNLQEKNSNFTFYPLTADCFSTVQDMPTALGHMLTLLDACTKEEELLQWQHMSRLSLTTTGAIRAIHDATTGISHTCNFVSTEMQVQPDNYGNVGYSTLNNWQKIGTISNQELFEQQFYRYIAGQCNSLPSSFYRQALQAIADKHFDPPLPRQLAGILLATTTVDPMIPVEQTEQAFLTHWNTILNSLANLKLPGALKLKEKDIRAQLVNSLFTLHALPPLPLFHNVLDLLTAAIQPTHYIPGVAEVSAFQSAKKLKKYLDQVNAITDSYADLFYYGMRFYTGNDFKKTGDNAILYQHLDLCYPAFANKPFDPVYLLLLPLISTFQINTLEQFNQCYEKMHELYDMNDFNAQNAMNYLRYFERNQIDSKTLTPDQLTAFIDAVKEEHQKQNHENYIALLETHFSSCYNKATLDNIKGQGLSDSVQKHIQRAFNKNEQKLVITLLNQLQHEPIHDPYFYSIHCLQTMLKSMQPKERETLLSLLATPVFYQKHDHSDKKIPLLWFNSFLNRCMTSGNHQHFIRLAKSPYANNATDVLWKANFYIETVLPLLRKENPIPVHELHLIQQLLLSEKTATDIENYTTQFVAFIQKTHVLSEQAPQMQKKMIQFIQTHLATCDTREAPLVNHALTTVDLLKNLTSNMADHVDVITTLLQHAKEKNPAWFTTNRLCKLLTSKHFTDLDPEKQKQLLMIITCLFSNAQTVNDDDLEKLLGIIQDNNDIHHYYKKAPFPPLDKLFEWYEQKLDDNQKRSDVVKIHYNAFAKKPFTRDNNAFDENFAKQQADTFSGVVISDNELTECKNATQIAKNLPIDELLNQLKQFHQSTLNPKTNLAWLIAITAELLYRSTGITLHTTQYLAIYALLKAGPHVAGGIGTGEGKSRIMTIVNACQCALGKTVDCVTENMQLAQRDHEKYQTYFNLLNIPTKLIRANTPFEQYCMGGLNFSDVSNLKLLRNKARSKGQGHLVIAETPQQRALSLDEGDKVLYDLSHHRYNCSDPIPHRSAMRWIYPRLVEFFSNPANIVTYQNDFYTCHDRFITFVKTHYPDDMEKQQALMAVAHEQMQEWYEAAMTAQKLQYHKDFIIQSHTLPTGEKVSQAKLIDGDRVSKYSKFSFGVHQCLEARLEDHRQKLHDKVKRNDPTLNAELIKVLETCPHPFEIAPEKQIIYSSSAKILLDDYAQSTLITVSGTPGSAIQQQEAALLYAHRQGDQITPLKFITVPRHQGLQRQDHAIHLTDNHEKKIDALVHYIQQARANKQPILLFCQDGQASKAMYDTLAKKLKLDESAIQHIHSDMSKKQEKAAIDKAGSPSMITISTSMCSRGTDIILQQDAKQGLCVLLDHVPSSRDYEQMISRSGRFGAAGDSRIVVDKRTFERDCGKITNTFYTSTDAFLQRRQLQMDKMQQRARLIKMLYADFNQALTDNFFENILAHAPSMDHTSLKHAWANFKKANDRSWLEHWSMIEVTLANKNIKADGIQQKLTAYRTQVVAEWQELKSNLDKADLSQQTKDQINKQWLQDNNIPNLHFNKKIKNLFNAKHNETGFMRNRKVYDKYDPTHDGRSVLYRHRFVLLLATLRGERAWFADFNAWRNGTGLVFPDLHALFRGHITLREFFTNKASKKTARDHHKNDAAADNNYFAQEQQQAAKRHYPKKSRLTRAHSAPSFFTMPGKAEPEPAPTPSSLQPKKKRNYSPHC
jgi:superfamily II DNA/RNA helicase